LLASLDQPDDDFDTPALELSQSIFDHGALDAAPGKFGVSETNPPLAGLSLGGLRLQEIGYRQQCLQSQHHLLGRLAALIFSNACARMRKRRRLRRHWGKMPGAGREGCPK
jgi:hypothetical protein